MALKIDDVMNLSLDDYIAISKKSSSSKDCIANSGSSHDKGSNTSVCSNDVKFGRRKGNIDDEEGDEEEVLSLREFQEEIEEVNNVNNASNETGIWKAPDSSISYLDFNTSNDLRQKINNSNNSRKECLTSVQYRLKAPNNAGNRPRGIPTLLPLDAYVNKNNNNNKNRGNHRFRYKGIRFGVSNSQRGFNKGCKNFPQFNNNSVGINGLNNGRIQRNRKQEIDSKNFRFSLRRDNVNEMNTSATARPAQNMIVETSSSHINLQPSAPLNSSFQIPYTDTTSERGNYGGSHSISVGNLTPQVEAKLDLNSTMNSNSNNECLKSILGFQGNISGDMMPAFANRLLEFMQAGLQTQVHKPIYDMKIQKDIHEIQGKPLLYKCPGGEVVSSDGAGVNCKIIPRTSGVSLNCRFA